MISGEIILYRVLSILTSLNHCAFGTFNSIREEDNFLDNLVEIQLDIINHGTNYDVLYRTNATIIKKAVEKKGTEKK